MSSPLDVKRFHESLVAFYHRHGDEIKSYWLSFGRTKRLLCTQPHLHDKVDPTGRMFVQELIISDIIKESSSRFIECLESRATRSIYNQIFTSYNGWVTDYAYIERMVVCKEINPSMSIFEGPCITVIDNMLIPGKESDGRLNNTTDENKTKKTRRITMSHLSLIAQRQFRMFHFLSSTMQEILDLGRESKQQKGFPGSKATALTVLPDLASYQPCAAHITNIALENATIAEEESCRNFEMPGYLKDQVKGFLDCRPELVPDDKGQVKLAQAPKSTGIALSDILHRESKRMITWQYTYELLKALNLRPDDKSFRHRILQQLSNVCQMEYVQAQDLLRRHMQTRSGRMFFRRCQNSLDGMGNPRVIMKEKKPETLVELDTPLYYLLCFCNPETGPAESWQSFNKLQSFYEKHPNRRPLLTNDECQSMRVLYTIVSFIHSLSLAFRMPSFSRKRENKFVLGIQMEDAKAVQAKPHIDVERFVRPIRKLQNLKAARIAIGQVAECFEKAGSGNLYEMYENVATKCLQQIHNQSPKSKVEPGVESHLQPTASKPEGCTLPRTPEQVGVGTKADLTEGTLSIDENEPVQIPTTIETPVSLQPQLVRSKELVPDQKVPEAEESEISRPALREAELSETRLPTPPEAEGPEISLPTAGINKRTPTLQCPSDKKMKKPLRQKGKRGKEGKEQVQMGSKQAPQTTPTVPTGRKLAVSSSAAKVFDTLFDKSVARGGVHWSSFEGAMAELGFQIVYNTGSAVTFEPPSSMELMRSLTLHRPHGPRVEGSALYELTWRLIHTFGWGADTFVLSKR